MDDLAGDDACESPCPTGCAVCTSNLASQCTECTDDGAGVDYFLELDGKGCRQTCPVRYYGDNVTH